ncbi:MAG TPA: hypothetical protein GXX75_20550 [Clostridiales bacterium]|nr:hypothetical protein [Clostridiales bacterium]
MDRIMYEQKQRIKTSRVYISAILLLLALVVYATQAKTASAASSITVTEINYLESTVTLKVNGDTKVYFSDSKKTTWDEVPGDIGSDSKITMDISWIPVTQNYVLNFKGDVSTDIVSVTIPKQATNFKASFNKAKGVVTFSNAGTRTVEWRKDGSTAWNTVDTNTFAAQLSYLFDNGAVLRFRLAPVNGTSSMDVGARASKEVAVTISKKAAAPNVTVNGSSFTIAVKKGMAYRYVNADGTTTDWTTISSSASLLLSDVAAKALYREGGTTQSKVTLQFRSNASSSSMVSKIATVTVPVQEGPPDENTYGISLSYLSSSSLSLTVKAASSTVPFEYTVVEADDELSYTSASWTTVSSSTAVTLTKAKAPAGSHIYVRKKSVAATDTVDFALASQEIDITGTQGVVYPDALTATTLTTLITTAGVCRTDDSSSYLSFTFYSPTQTTVSSVRFIDSYGISAGTVTCKSTVSKNASSTSNNDKYIITTKITSTSTIDTATEKLLYAELTLANSEVITSTDQSGLRLYIYPGSTLNNPKNDDTYTGEFNRIYLSNESQDKKNFKFQLDFGTSKIADKTAVNAFTSENVAISSMKYDGYTLAKDTDYTAVYGSYVNDDGETVSTATVTVNVSAFEASSLIDTTDKKEALVITLNNGEILRDKVYITLTNTATLDEAPVAWSITEGSLKETTTSTVTNPDNTTTTVTQEVVSFSLGLTLFDKSYSVSVADVTWGGTSIFGSAEVTGGKATIYLSNAKINKLSTTSTDTKNIVITLSNGYVIKTGCKLTILNAH